MSGFRINQTSLRRSANTSRTPESSPRLLQQELRACEDSGVEYDAMNPVGPDHIWSLHTHTIFEPFGITLYGAIDTFSKAVIWMDVCLPHQAEQSMLAGYLRYIEEVGVMPEVLRLDNNQKQSSVAMTHLDLSNYVCSKQDEGEFGEEQVLLKQSRPLEGYWAQQTTHALGPLRDHFNDIDEIGMYYGKSIIDRIEFLAVYVPLLRKVTSTYAALHNRNRIRKQKERPSFVPLVRYDCPLLSGDKHRGFKISPATLKPWRDFGAFDEANYLPQRTQGWCEQCLAAKGIRDMPETGLMHMHRDDEKKHEVAYRHLTTSLYAYMNRLHELKLEDLYDNGDPPASLATAVAEDDEDVPDMVKHQEQTRAAWCDWEPFVASRASA